LKIKFPDALHVRLPRGLAPAIEEAARNRCTSHSEWVRQALIDRLRHEGLFLGDVAGQASQQESPPWRA
jgi:hypothetical protein